MESVIRPQREIPILARTEVLVVGSGPAGIAAAVASARTGAKTMLAERYGCFGGALAVGQVESYNWYFNEETCTAGGIVAEIEQRMVRMQGVQRDDRGTGHFLNPEIYKIMLDRWVKEENITPLLHALAVDVIREGDAVKGVVFESKSGCGAVLADCVIDATGDGDVAVRAGAGYEMGDKDRRDVLPVTMVFGVNGVDVQAFRDHIKAHKELITPETHGLGHLFRQARRDGKWPYESEGGAWKTLTPSGEFTSMNITREFRIDGTDVWDLTKAEMDGRQQVLDAIEVLREYGADMGFAHCGLRSFAFQIGIRETRRILCDYMISQADVLGEAQFADSVGVFTRFVDGEVIAHDSRHFQIPYRCILPAGIDGLLVAGRCVGCRQDAIQTMRMMVCCASTGQAAGTAAALAVKGQKAPRALEVSKLQEALVEKGVRLS